MSRAHNQPQQTCVFCHAPLDSTNRSEEHIIPAALGGTLKSTQIVCRGCNSRAGGSIDAALCDGLEFLTILFTVKHSTKRPSHQPEVKFTAPDGRPLSFRPGSGYVTLEKPLVEEHVEGEFTRFTFTAPPGELYEKHVAQKVASIERKHGSGSVALHTVEDVIEVAPPVPFFPAAASVDPRVKRAVAKIALEYACHSLRTIKAAELDCSDIRSYVLDEGMRAEEAVVPYPVGTSELCFACPPPMHCVACVRTARTLWAVVVIYGVMSFKVRIALNLPDETNFAVAHLIDPLSHRNVESAEIADLALSLTTRSESMETASIEMFCSFLQFLDTSCARENNVKVSESQMRPGLHELARAGVISEDDIEAIVADLCVSGR